MADYKRLWNNRKMELAMEIIGAPNQNCCQNAAKQLAEMNRLECLESKPELNVREKPEEFFQQLADVIQPAVEFLREHFDPHTQIFIEDGFVIIMSDQCGMPIKEGK